MIFHDVAQGSPEWHVLRLGVPTASEFCKIITPKTMQLSKQADEYANLKIAEMMTGEPQGLLQPTYAMERGKAMEVEARDAYEFTNNVTVQNGGFITDDKGHVGCSTDFLVGDDGSGEIKCLFAKSHIKHLIEQEVKPEHMPQVQGQLMIAEREWCDWWMYHPDLPRVGIRTYRDEVYIKKLSQCIDSFRDLMNEKIEKLQAMDCFEIRQPVLEEPQSTYMAG